MMRGSIAVGFWFAAHCFGYASPPPQVWQFLRPLLVRESQSAGDIWSRTGSGGYVLRFDLDVTGDRLADMFVTSTLDMVKYASVWRVYKATANGYERFRPVDAYVQLNPSEIWVERRGDSIAFVSKGHDRFGVDNFNWYIGRYIFIDSEIRVERNVVPKETAEAVEEWPTITKVKPEIYGVLLADLLENPDAEWKRIDFSDAARDPDGYYIARGDVDRVRQLKDFTPQVALHRLDRILAKLHEQPK